HALVALDGNAETPGYGARVRACLYEAHAIDHVPVRSEVDLPMAQVRLAHNVVPTPVEQGVILLAEVDVGVAEAHDLGGPGVGAVAPLQRVLPILGLRHAERADDARRLDGVQDRLVE